jgi:putative oxidoreductase
VQRLFSVFPNAWPGAGLLLLRVAAGLPAIADGITALADGISSPIQWLHVLELTAGSLLFVGLWTPIAGVLQAATLGCLAVGQGTLDTRSLVLAAIGVSLAMLGPGAWSIDARLYGRKRIDVPGNQP